MLKKCQRFILFVINSIYKTTGNGTEYLLLLQMECF